MIRTHLILCSHPFNISKQHAKIACKLLSLREHNLQSFWSITDKRGYRRFYTKCGKFEFQKFKHEYIEYIIGVRDSLRYVRRIK